MLSETLQGSIIGGVLVILGSLIGILIKQNFEKRNMKKQKLEKQLEEFYGPLGFLGAMLDYSNKIQSNLSKKRSDLLQDINKRMEEHNNALGPQANSFEFIPEKRKLSKVYLDFLIFHDSEIKENYRNQLRNLIRENFSLIESKDMEKLLSACYKEHLSTLVQYFNKRDKNGVKAIFEDEIINLNEQLPPCSCSELIEMHKAKLEEYNNL